MSISPALVCNSATLFSYEVMGLFSSAAAVVVVAGGGTLASVVGAVLAAVVAAGVPAVSLFAVLAGVHAAIARTNNPKIVFLKRASFVGLGANPTTQAGRGVERVRAQPRRCASA